MPKYSPETDRFGKNLDNNHRLSNAYREKGAMFIERRVSLMVFGVFTMVFGRRERYKSGSGRYHDEIEHTCV